MITIAANIIKVDRKFSNLIDNEPEEDQKPTGLISIASDILSEQKPNNLISMAGDILNEPKTSNLVSMASDIMNEQNSSNLISMAGDILEREPGASSNLAEIAENIRQKDAIGAQTKGSSLNESLEEISDLEDEKTSNLIGMAGDIMRCSPPKNLINIANDIFEPEEQRSNLSRITAEVLEADKREEDEEDDEEVVKVLVRESVSDKEKLNIISELTLTLNELRIDPQFPISWLLLYMNSLQSLEADSLIRSTFNKWTWSGMYDLKSNTKELSSVPPSVMVQLAQDISSNSKDESGPIKVIKNFRN